MRPLPAITASATGLETCVCWTVGHDPCNSRHSGCQTVSRCSARVALTTTFWFWHYVVLLTPPACSAWSIIAISSTVGNNPKFPCRATHAGANHGRCRNTPRLRVLGLRFARLPERLQRVWHARQLWFISRRIRSRTPHATESRDALRLISAGFAWFWQSALLRTAERIDALSTENAHDVIASSRRRLQEFLV